MKRTRNITGRPVFGLLCAAMLLSGCGGTSSLTTATLPPTEQAAPDGPVSLVQSSSNSAAPALSNALMPVPQDQVKRAVERFLLNSGGQPATNRVAGADLDGDNTPEALVYLEGANWCASTGCTLMIMRKERTGYQMISLVKRVKLPIAIASTASNGWRNLLVNSGQLGATKLVALTFNGSGYPVNASGLPATTPQLDRPTEIAIAPTLTAARQAVAGTDLIANQN